MKGLQKAEMSVRPACDLTRACRKLHPTPQEPLEYAGGEGFKARIDRAGFALREIDPIIAAEGIVIFCRLQAMHGWQRRSSRSMRLMMRFRGAHANPTWAEAEFTLVHHPCMCGL